MITLHLLKNIHQAFFSIVEEDFQEIVTTFMGPGPSRTVASRMYREYRRDPVAWLIKYEKSEVGRLIFARMVERHGKSEDELKKERKPR